MALMVGEGCSQGACGACGTGGWTGPKPGDPDNNVTISATPTFGGVEVSWSYPATHPYAVAHVRLFRASSASFDAAIEIAVAAGSRYFDRNTTGTTIGYWYWLRVVSVNGTVGEPVGPATALSSPAIDDILQDLAGRIEAGALAQSLKGEIDRITLHYAELVGEINARVAANHALAQALAQVQSGVDSALSFIGTEITQRQEGDSALAIQVNSIAAAHASNLALIQQVDDARVDDREALGLQLSSVSAIAAAAQSTASTAAADLVTERLARIAADSALALEVDALRTAANDGSAAAILDVQTARIGYAAVVATGVAFDGDGVTVVYPAPSYPQATFPQYASDRTRIVDKVGVVNWNATAAGAAKPLTWVVGLPLASAVKTVQVTGPDGQTASVQAAFGAQKDLNNQFKAMYTARVDVNGLVGGFGLYNDGSVVEAGFDVDRFWIGRTSANKVKPFVIEGGIVYIDAAVIRTITADKIDSRGLTIKDAAGNVLFGSGTALGVANISGLGTLATRNNVTTAMVTGLGTLATANAVTTSQVTGLGALATANTVTAGQVTGLGALATASSVNWNTQITNLPAFGNFAYLSSITSANIGTYLSGAAIGSAYIADAAITSAKIADLQIGTAKIANQAVTFPVFKEELTSVNGSVASVYELIRLSYACSGASAAVFFYADALTGSNQPIAPWLQVPTPGYGALDEATNSPYFIDLVLQVGDGTAANWSDRNLIARFRSVTVSGVDSPTTSTATAFLAPFMVHLTNMGAYAGTTVQLRLIVRNSWTTASYTARINHRRLFLIETKK